MPESDNSARRVRDIAATAALAAGTVGVGALAYKGVKAINSLQKRGMAVMRRTHSTASVFPEAMREMTEKNLIPVLEPLQRTAENLKSASGIWGGAGRIFEASPLPKIIDKVIVPGAAAIRQTPAAFKAGLRGKTRPDAHGTKIGRKARDLWDSFKSNYGKAPTMMSAREELDSIRLGAQPQKIITKAITSPQLEAARMTKEEMAEWMARKAEASKLPVKPMIFSAIDLAADPRGRNELGMFTGSDDGPQPNNIGIVYKQGPQPMGMGKMIAGSAAGTVAGAGAVTGIKSLLEKIKGTKMKLSARDQLDSIIYFKEGGDYKRHWSQKKTAKKKCADCGDTPCSCHTMSAGEELGVIRFASSAPAQRAAFVVKKVRDQFKGMSKLDIAALQARGGSNLNGIVRDSLAKMVRENRNNTAVMRGLRGKVANLAQLSAREALDTILFARGDYILRAMQMKGGQMPVNQAQAIVGAIRGHSGQYSQGLLRPNLGTSAKDTLEGMAATRSHIAGQVRGQRHLLRRQGPMPAGGGSREVLHNAARSLPQLGPKQPSFLDNLKKRLSGMGGALMARSAGTNYNYSAREELGHIIEFRRADPDAEMKGAWMWDQQAGKFGPATYGQVQSASADPNGYNGPQIIRRVSIGGPRMRLDLKNKKKIIRDRAGIETESDFSAREELDSIINFAYPDEEDRGRHWGRGAAIGGTIAAGYGAIDNPRWARSIGTEALEKVSAEKGLTGMAGRTASTMAKGGLKGRAIGGALLLPAGLASGAMMGGLFKKKTATQELSAILFAYEDEDPETSIYSKWGAGAGLVGGGVAGLALPTLARRNMAASPQTMGQGPATRGIGESFRNAGNTISGEYAANRAAPSGRGAFGRDPNGPIRAALKTAGSGNAVSGLASDLGNTEAGMAAKRANFAGNKRVAGLKWKGRGFLGAGLGLAGAGAGYLGGKLFET